MQLRSTLLVVFISIVSLALGQNTAGQKDSIGKNPTPIDGKAIVYIIRSSSFGALIKMNVDCDSVHIGSTKAKRYIYTVITPGKHSFVSRSENDYTLDLDTEAGKIYYIKQEPKMGVLYAETKLEVLNEEDGKKYLAKCKLSKDNVYTN
jgi:hypothetical protein